MLFLLPLDPGVEMVVSSTGISKGVEQTNGPQVIPKAYIQAGDLQFGGQWKNVTSATAEGEASAFVNASRKFGSYSVAFGAAYKLQTGARRGTDSDSFEFTGALTRRIGRLSLKIGAVYSPDDLGGTKQSLYVEGGPSFDLTKTLRLSANLGRRTRENNIDYAAMNIGATKTLVRGFALDLRYYRTNRSNLDDIYRSRAVVSGRWTF
ncbi:MAG TPA: TorF family putative porin [Sphingomicrobium sp.]|nr:TorF family putative porin [Sphingomicrobium sp.]